MDNKYKTKMEKNMIRKNFINGYWSAFRKPKLLTKDIWPWTSRWGLLGSKDFFGARTLFR